MHKALVAPVVLAFVLAPACRGADPSDLFGEEGDASGGGSTGGTTGGGTAGTTTGGGTAGTTTGGGTAGTTAGTTGSSTGTTAGATTGGTTGDPASCSASGPPCAAGTVCRATGCKTGVCVAVAGSDTDLAAVCGCDGFTYWNGRLAGAKGVAVRGSGPCTNVASGNPVPCGGLNAAVCPAGSACNLEAANGGACVTAVQGSCWIVPSTCSQGAGLGPLRRRCAGGPGSSCAGQCSFIESGVSYYQDPSCK